MTSFEDLDWDQLMDYEAKQSVPLMLSDEDVQRFNQRTLLYKLDQGYVWPIIADSTHPSSFLQDILPALLTENYVEVEGDAYILTVAGQEELERMAEQYHSLVNHYDVFAHVDIDAGCFLEPGDDPHAQVNIDGEVYPRFIDLRVAVMRFKGVEPFDMVFLNLLREQRIAAKDSWEFDMALGKALYDELETIVNTAYTVKDLTDLEKTNDHGEIPGSDILKDVIVAGNQRNQALAMAERATPRHDEPARPQITVQVVEQAPLFVEYAYEPYVYYEDYYDPFYVEPAWRHYGYRPWFN
jgi:hypothetical protein